MEPRIRTASVDDAASIARIYNHYIAETVVTFETAAIDAAEMMQRIAQVQALPLPWLVAEDAQGVIGYAYATKWRERDAYRQSVESTVYLDPARTGRGVGMKLYAELIAQLRRLSLHAAMGGVALPNAASIALHERLGFRKVAHFAEVGFKHGRWIDVGYWQLLLGNL